MDHQTNAKLVWPSEGLSHIPDWVYTSEDIFQKERTKIFLGDCWNFVALEAEFPEPAHTKDLISAISLSLFHAIEKGKLMFLRTGVPIEA